jgi:hypothetical protein
LAARSSLFAALAVCLIGATIACAPKSLQLPTTTPVALDDATPMVREALPQCGAMTSVTAELGLSGRVGSAKLRGRLQAGFARPGRLRLEAVAPFGAPFFIVAGTGGQATMWLPRDARVLRDVAPAAILDALAGLSVEPDMLGAWIAGCPSPDFRASAARAYGADWVAIEGSGRTAWLRRSGAWRLVRSDGDGLHVEFADHVETTPGRLRIQRADASAAPALDLRMAVSQVETNVALDDKAFSVDVPADAAPMTLDELRASGPLRDAVSTKTP